MENNNILVISPILAKKLLKMNYKIVDIKPHRKIENATVFYFENEDGIHDEVEEYRKIAKENKLKLNQENED